MEFSEISKRYGKTTKPPGFGLVPEVRSFASLALHVGEGWRKAIEYVKATPLEYLDRWIFCNELFGDDVELVSVVRWSDGQVSFGITQPQYHGEKAAVRDVEKHFKEGGWVRLNDPSGHLVFYNFGFNVLAIDLEGRNCYVNGEILLPFDVILREPDNELAEFLGIW